MNPIREASTRTCDRPSNRNNMPAVCRGVRFGEPERSNLQSKLGMGTTCTKTFAKRVFELQCRKALSLTGDEGFDCPFGEGHTSSWASWYTLTREIATSTKGPINDYAGPVPVEVCGSFLAKKSQMRTNAEVQDYCNTVLVIE